jgi:hypothetical protein
MKIADILIEKDTLAAAAGRAVSAGQAAADRIMSPSKWLQGGGGSDSDSESDTPKPKSFEYKQTLSALSQNQALDQNDLARVKTLYNEFRSGKRSSRSADSGEMIAALKRVLDNQQRYKSDNQLFADLAAEF